MTRHIKKQKYSDTEMLTFYNEFFNKIRCVIINDTAWFVGIDVAEAIGYKNPTRAVLYHVDEEDMIRPNERRHIDRNQNLISIPPRAQAVVNGMVQFPYITDMLGRAKRVVWINEAGVNELITNRSDSLYMPITNDPDGPTVKDIRDWIHGTVLPSIHHYGAFGVTSQTELEERMQRYHDHHAIDSDGFIRLLPTPGGRFDQYCKKLIGMRVLSD